MSCLHLAYPPKSTLPYIAGLVVNFGHSFIHGTLTLSWILWMYRIFVVFNGVSVLARKSSLVRAFIVIRFHIVELEVSSRPNFGPLSRDRLAPRSLRQLHPLLHAVNADGST